MTPGFEIAVTLKGKNLQEVLTQAQALLDADHTPATATAGAVTPKPKKNAATRLAPPPPVEDETDLLAPEDSEELAAADDGEQLGFDMEEEPAPKKTAKATKITDKDVNTAAMAHAKVNGRNKTLAILEKKFKVKSILELKADQYPAVIAALKV